MLRVLSGGLTGQGVAQDVEALNMALAGMAAQIVRLQRHLARLQTNVARAEALQAERPRPRPNLRLVEPPADTPAGRAELERIA